MTVQVKSVRCLYKQEKVTAERLENTVNAFIDTIKKKIGDEIEQKGFKIGRNETVIID